SRRGRRRSTDCLAARMASSRSTIKQKCPAGSAGGIRMADTREALVEGQCALRELPASRGRGLPLPTGDEMQHLDTHYLLGPLIDGDVAHGDVAAVRARPGSFG